ncbi:MAG: amylo-alpha-1,6-glucosidase [Syntrophales bacterium]|jgi:predicted glycogen debranching enzyme|nr:amylo-alpha-1,6-glucosidase [Syntrophales bacterium]MCK9528873.1 amylo-alpha-1,6-glucosidase [Syntrophales bacterium]MDX9921153.1 amylo-alpha-1,6-glucosidase [Syntrophales bacterium]
MELTMRGLTLDSALSKEWIETDGRGGYASSTILNCNTRKYHGLLVCRLPGSGGRCVLLSKLEDSIITGGKEISLSMHQYPLVLVPGELKAFARFSMDSHPRFLYRAGAVGMEKEILLLRGMNTLLVRYRYGSGSGPILLRVKPLLAFRGIHELSKENPFFRTELEMSDRGFSIAPYAAMPGLHVGTGGAMRVMPGAFWYRNFEYLLEMKRGFPFREDLLMPAILECGMEPGTSRILSFSLDEVEDSGRLWTREIQRRRRRRRSREERAGDRNHLPACLGKAADSYLVKDAAGTPSVIAGYHWFYVWGRDTLISLPGLTFRRGMIREGIEILKAMARLRRNGLIPNCLSDRSGENAYNSADGSLWYFWCLQELVEASGDMGLIKRFFWPVMKDILSRYRDGSAAPAALLENGLVTVGDATTQLTWMDAVVDCVPVTPRGGCPVEINALWFNALSFMRDVSRALDMDPGFDAASLIEKTRKSFNDLFWIPGGNYLADVCNTTDGSRDESVRPNQIFAVSLPCSPLEDRERARQVVAKVTDELLTPCGLRTLSPRDPRYRGRYEGDAASRDRAYHQGTVWPWLLGHYGEALLKTAENKAAARKTLRTILSQFEGHLQDAGLGHVSEVFDGDEPHRPSGCIAQAWSVAELIRLSRLVQSRRTRASRGVS